MVGVSDEHIVIPIPFISSHPYYPQGGWSFDVQDMQGTVQFNSALTTGRITNLRSPSRTQEAGVF